MSHFDYKPFYRRNLPHIQPPGATFFVTFHLAGSLPRAVLQQWKGEKCQLDGVEDITFDQKQKQRDWERQWFRKFEKTLDNAQSGPLWLKDDRIAKEVAESLHYRDGKVYRMDAYCIMANHVHVVFAPLALQPAGHAQTNNLRYNTLASIMQSLKGYTAWNANRLLGRSGAFWHHESYDRSVRNTNEWQRIVTYVLNNPVKAGLIKDWQEWRWSYYRGFRGTTTCAFTENTMYK